ncbi:hypothetical protein F7725_012901 [Dissostichus mawsoni]|uniref:Kinesin motor domain-containing protein n=1 Tax=Dissostichus mawsoni TaxID=36200 RepID=A0A7J5YQX3_DISMA|nr:hypothetical protein F7725_012901 [Dissostichus mawsoni]
MSLSLYECLRAVGLQRHYARFTSVGICRAAHLSALTMEDYPILGICCMEDRTQLFNLVQMVKTLDLEYENSEDYGADSGDEGYTAADSSFSYVGGEDQEDVYNDENERGAAEMRQGRAKGRPYLCSLTLEVLRHVAAKGRTTTGWIRIGINLVHRFYFDQVFGEESSNEEVYQRTAYPLVQHMLNGGKATCFAYGQTGAGKTHTMLGSPVRPGLYALAVRDIFAHLSTTHMNSPLLVYVSFFEIYCGQLYDLLDHRKRLFAREDGLKVVHIVGLRDVRVDSVSSLMEVISQGTEVRTQGVSGVNPLSSRSHALLQIQLRDANQQIAGRVKELKGQGGLRGGRRGKTNHSPKRNLSNSSSSSRKSTSSIIGTRGKSPPKKPKLGRHREDFCPISPTIRLTMGGENLCSTPKNSRWGEETTATTRKGIDFEHITPVGGLLGMSGRRDRTDRADRREGGSGDAWRVSRDGKEERFGQDRDTHEKLRSLKAAGEGEVRVRREEWRPAMEGKGVGRWAWVASTETEQADRMTGAILDEAVVLYNRHSEEGEEGLNASDVTADRVCSTEERRGADNYGFLSSQRNIDSSSLFNRPLDESSRQRATAERPLSPACGQPNSLLTPNPSFELKHTTCTSNIEPIPLKNVHQEVPLSSCRVKPPWFNAYDNIPDFSNSQWATLPLTTPTTQNRGKIPAEPFNISSENPANTMIHNGPDADAKKSELPQEETADSISFVMDPLSISLLQVDQQADNLSFLQWDQNRTAASLPKTSTRSSMQTSVMQSNSSSVNQSANTGSLSTHDLTTNGPNQKPSEHAHNMHKELSLAISTPQSERVLGQLTTAPKHCQTVHSNTSIQTNSPLQLNNQESTSNQQIRPICLSRLEDLDHGQ